MRRTIYRLGGLLAASLLISTAVAGPSSADTPEKFVANAAGRALALRVLGNDLTFGVSTAAVEPLKAVATGQGQLLAATDALTSSVTAEGSDAKAQKCGPVSLPAEVAGIVSLSAACSGATLAEITNGLPRASGEGSVASLGLNASTVLNEVLGDVEIGETLDSTLSPLLDPVEEQTGIDAKTTLLDLVNSVLETKTLDVSLGKATSDVATTATSVTSKATASGAEIKILPTPELFKNGLPVLEPLATITVSSSSATATYNRATGAATPSFDAALVRVRFNSALPLPTLEIKPGTTQTILEGTPLESTIAVADGSTSKSADGGVGAIADGVSLQLLKGVGESKANARDGGLGFQLAHSEVNVAGKVATKVVAPPKPAAPIVKSDTLPRTGGMPWMPIAGAGALGLAVLVRRTRLAQS